MSHPLYTRAGGRMAQAWTSLFAGVMAVAALSGASGCGPVFVPNTGVRDTSENRAVLLACERYRHALEEGDPARILEQTSPAFFQDPIGEVPMMDLERYRSFVREELPKWRELRFDAHYEDVVRTESGHVVVPYGYDVHWRSGDGPDDLHHVRGRTRFDLVANGESFLVVGGVPIGPGHAGSPAPD